MCIFVPIKCLLYFIHLIMRKQSPLLLGVSLIGLFVGLASCNFKKGEQAQNKPIDNTADTTVYGISDEFGQSTFSLITEKGDTLFLLREQPNGDPSFIAGDIEEETPYAITYTSQDKELYLLTAINTQQLVSLLKDKYTYHLYNGKLILEGDTTELITLTSDSLIAKGKKQAQYIIKK